jgi:uncharacterized protein (DUF433 family)
VTGSGRWADWPRRVARNRKKSDYAEMTDTLIIRDPDTLGGEPVFAGTRVLVKTLTDYLEAGDSIDVFLDDFPSVRREQVIQFLNEARERLIADAA